MNIPTNLKLIESGTVPTTTTLQKGEMAFGQVPLTGAIRLYVNADNSIIELSVNEQEQITYNNLLSKVKTNKLEIGKKYLITDYQTIYKQPVTDLVITNTVVEPLIVKAMSTGSLAPFAFSKTHPKDILYYDINNNQKLYEWAVPNGKGVIYRRIDQYENDLPYDFKVVKFRRWAVDYANTPAFNPSTAGYNLGDIVKFNNDNLLYLCTKTYTTTLTTPVNNENWCTILNNVAGSEKIYYSIVNTGISITFQQKTFKIPVDANDYKDYYTFHNDTKNTEFTLDGRVFNNSIKPYISSMDTRNLNNSVFISCPGQIPHFNNNIIGADSYNNTIKTTQYFDKNNIGNNFHDNIILDHFRGNVIQNDFHKNLIGVNFHTNVVENFFRFNTISDNFSCNTVEAFFNQNLVQQSFYYNNIGVYFERNNTGGVTTYNVFGNNINNNVFGRDFNFNNIGHSFNNCTISKNGFAYNNVDINVSYRNLTTISEIFGKTYPHTITKGGSHIIVTWYDNSGNPQIQKI
jgi:hypothetical protein